MNSPSYGHVIQEIIRKLCKVQHFGLFWWQGTVLHNVWVNVVELRPQI